MAYELVELSTGNLVGAYDTEQAALHDVAEAIRYELPEAYEDQPGFDFVVDVPTTWDQTKFVAGEAGEYLVLARRSGNTWYLGGITNWTPRELKLPLDFPRRRAV